MTTADARRSGRRPGPKPRLSRDIVVEAATRAEPLTISSVAALLGVSVGSLYRHVAGLDDLAAGAAAHLLATAPLPDPSSGWRAFLEREAAVQIRLRRDHGHLFAMAAADRPGVGLRRSERVVGVLVELGFDVDDALLVTDSIVDVIRDGVRQARSIEAYDGPPPPGLSPGVEGALRRVMVDPWAFLDRKVALVLDGVRAGPID